MSDRRLAQNSDIRAKLDRILSVVEDTRARVLMAQSAMRQLVLVTEQIWRAIFKADSEQLTQIFGDLMHRSDGKNGDPGTSGAL